MHPLQLDKIGHVWEDCINLLPVNLLKLMGNIMLKQLTAIIEREGSGYVSLFPELCIASQSDTIEEARMNLREALELFFETSSSTEIQSRLPEYELELFNS